MPNSKQIKTTSTHIKNRKTWEDIEFLCFFMDDETKEYVKQAMRCYNRDLDYLNRESNAYRNIYKLGKLQEEK